MSDNNETTDLGALDTAVAANKGAEVELLHPVSQKPVGVFIGVFGKDSDIFRQHMRDDVDARIRRESAANRRGKPVEPQTASQAEEKAVELLAVCTYGWRTETYATEDGKRVVKTNDPHIVINGEKLTFNAMNALRLYREQLWIRRQVDEAIGDLERFMSA
jgi:hypothetical protein